MIHSPVARPPGAPEALFESAVQRMRELSKENLGGADNPTVGGGCAHAYFSYANWIKARAHSALFRFDARGA